MSRRLTRLGQSVFVIAAVFLLTPFTHAQDEAAALYKSKCAACHGADGKGDTAMGKSQKLRDLGSDEVQKQIDAQLTDITANGKGKMPAYKGKVSDDQIKQLVAFMRSLKKK